MVTRYPIKLFSNRELADNLGINLARWKRWVRDFLPPDPLAGRQSGYARQFYLNDAFHVYLAGILVGDLRMTVPEVQHLMDQMEPHLSDIGYRFDPAGGALPDPVHYVISIRFDSAGAVVCQLNGFGAGAPAPVFFGSGDRNDRMAICSSRDVHLTECLRWFLACVDPGNIFFERLFKSLPKRPSRDRGQPIP